MKQVLRVILAILLLVTFSCGLVACSPVDHADSTNTKGSTMPNTTYQTITAQQAKSLMEEAVPYVLLDVRTEAEYQEGHIEGALLIPDNELPARSQVELPNKEERILVYCRSGRRSAQSAEMLASKGYSNVYDFGGIGDWPYGIVKN